MIILTIDLTEGVFPAVNRALAALVREMRIEAAAQW